MYPAPVIALAKGLGATETMTAFLVEGSSNYELQEGFQSGQVRGMLIEMKNLTFTSYQRRRKLLSVQWTKD